jgi:LuxR family maltose regulon positive regulatory protein
VSAACPALPFDIVLAKVRVPDVRPDTVHRAALVNRLRVARSRQLITVFGGAGYGKTTLLAQWAKRDGRPFAWISVDDHDNDAIVLLRHVAVALDRIAPLDARVLDALRSRRRSIGSVALPRLSAAVAALDTPVVIVFDNAARLSSKESLGAVASLAEHVPAGSTLVLAGRTPPRVPLAVARSEGRLFELGPSLLTFARRETQLLVQRAGVVLSADQLDELHERTEGWPAGLSLILRAARDDDLAACDATGLGGDDRYLADYFRSECLSELSADLRVFLRRVSVLGHLSGALCDAVVGRADSARRLEALATANMFVIPLDRRGEWYRFHPLFRELLRRELTLREPRRISALNRRAADWHETQNARDVAVEYALAAGDFEYAADLLTSCAVRACESGRIATVEGWLRVFAMSTRLHRYPTVAATGAWIHALRGRRSEAESWLAAAEHGKTRRDLPVICLVRAALCRDGIDRMVSDAENAVARLPAESDWRPVALLLEGASHALAGDNQRADEILAEAAEEARGRAADGAQVAAMSVRALVAAASAQDDAAETLALAAHELAAGRERGGVATDALELAVSTRALLRRARWEEAQAELESLKRLTPSLTPALPWVAVQALLELARAEITLRDTDGAQEALAEIGTILDRRPHLGVLVAQAEEVEREVEALATSRPSSKSALTAAELRLLPLLTTHLSFREIGDQFFVSRNTVKTQAISIYRKLGVTSRSQAIAAALRLGLVESPAGGVHVVSSALDDAVA